MLIRKHRDRGEAMIEHLQTASRDRLRADRHRGEEHPVWGGPGWVVFLETPADIRRVVRYVAQNPVKIGWPMQRWDWVAEYDSWLPGLSPHRADARRGNRPRNRER